MLNLLLSTILLGACGGGDSTYTYTSANPNTNNPIDILAKQVFNLPYQELDSSEEESFLFVREEEKVARDVYLYLYDLYEKITGQKYFPQILCPEDYEYIVTNCLPGNDCNISLQCQY
ncbi:MAG: hypothetical protein DSY42_08685 [Aquifex sp.]|nr:MAG: hypothetical protein DSY42_08685 [Aquifex sp.]